MLDVSDEFKALTVRGAVVLSKVEYQLVDGGPWLELLEPGVRALEDAYIDLTEQSWVRRTGSMTIGGRDALFDSWTHPCSPLNRFRLYRGVRLSRGQVEWLRLGTFVVTDFARKRPLGRTSLDLADFMWALDQDQLPLPIETAEDAPILPYIRRLITDAEADLPGVIDARITPAFPGASIIVRDGVDTAKLMPEAPVFTDGSRGEAIDYLARLLGATVHADVDGNFVIEPSLVTETTVTPVFRFKAGDGGTYSEIEQGGGFGDFANAVSIQNGDFVVESTITSGPLRLRSGFTHRYVEDVSTQSWDEDATSQYAQRVIAEKLGLAETVRATILPLPWLEPGDPVEVQDVDGIVTSHYLSTIDGLPLGAIGTCTVETRTLRLTSSVTAGLASGAIPSGIDPVIVAVYGSGETSSIASDPSAGDVALLLCRADAAPSGGWDVWEKVFDGGGTDTRLSMWVGTGAGTGTVEVAGGSGPGSIAIVVLERIDGNLLIGSTDTSESTSAALLAAGYVPARAGDIIVSAALGNDGYMPDEAGQIDALGFSANTGVITGTTPDHGVAWAVGIADGGQAGAEFPMTGTGSGQAVNLIVKVVAA